MTTRRIVCLANSRKPGGRCVAGLTWEEETDPAVWIRPIGHGETEAVTAQDRCYRDGTEPRLLDVMDVELLRPCTKSHQPENWLVDRDQYWDKTGELEPDDLFGLVDDLGPLWQSGYSTYHDINNRVPVDAAVNCSLRLIHVEDLVLRAFRPGADFGDDRVRVQARFSCAGEKYALRVTDPEVEGMYASIGSTHVGPSFLTVSLGEPHEGYFYKLVAALVPWS